MVGRTKYVAAIVPSIGTVVLLLLVILHVSEVGVGKDVAWGTLKFDTKSGGVEKTTVTRSCNAEARQQGVLLVTTASHEKIKEFNGVENVYEKIWQNRKAFTDQHGSHPSLSLAVPIPKNSNSLFCIPQIGYLGIPFIFNLWVC